MNSFRIAIFAHSINPRGGVPYAMIRVIRPETRLRLAQHALLAALAWDRSAAVHLPGDRRLAELLHA